MAARQERLIRGALLAAGLAACTAVQGHDHGLGRDEPQRREWLGAGFAFVGRADERFDLDDGPALVVDSGLDLTRGALRPALELGFTHSLHQVEAPEPTVDPDLSIGRVSLGLRLSLAPEGWTLAPHVRGGWFYRWSSFADEGFDAEPFDQDGDGTYIGVGLDVLRGRGDSWGPFFVIYTGDDGLEERLLGLGARLDL